MIARRDPRKHRELVAEFVDETHVQLEKLQSSRDASYWQSVMHRAKGSAALLGAEKFSALAEEVHSSVQIRLADEAQVYIEELRSALDDLQTAIATDSRH